MNKVILTGRLTSDPELRQTQTGIENVRFTIAVNRRVPNKNTGEREADFISCLAWRQTALFISKYFMKGQMIMVEGTLRTSTYQDKNHPDVKHYATDVYVENAEFCGDKKGNEQTSQPVPVQQNNQTADFSYGSLSDFEEILSDGDTPF